MKRIVVFGRPGSGKSTFATQLASRLELPVHHLDKHFFLENWVERDRDAFLTIQRALVEQEEWVIDGNAMRSLEMRFARAELALYFRFNPFVCLWRMWKRVFQKNWHIPDLAEGCTKNVRFRLIRYMLQFDKRYRARIDMLRERYPHVRFFLFTSDRDARRFLQELDGS